MPLLRVTTWNVLHRVHAVNWAEAAIDAFPDEVARVAGVAELVRGWLESGVDAVCLQEVSGDQLARLRAVAEGKADLFHHRYPRVPKLRVPGPPTLGDPSEHLAVLAAKGRGRPTGGRTFETDPGKGLLAVELDGAALVVCAHVTFGQPGLAQLRLLAQRAREASTTGIVAGDFNADATAVRAALGPDFALSAPRGERFSRVATPKSPAHTIDHLGIVRGAVERAEVLDGRGLSDHHPVAATLAPDDLRDQEDGARRGR